jgi:hypothetical protein
VLSFTQGIFIANDDRRTNLFTKPGQTVIGERPQDETDIALGESLFDVRNSGGEESIVTQIRVGVERHGSEENNYRLAEFIAKLDGHVQSGVVQRPLGALHPVDYTLPLRIRGSRRPQGDAGIEAECPDSHRLKLEENVETFSSSSPPFLLVVFLGLAKPVRDHGASAKLKMSLPAETATYWIPSTA